MKAQCVFITIMSMKKDAKQSVLTFAFFRDSFISMKTTRMLDSQGLAMVQQLVGINAKIAPYPAARSWSGGRWGGDL